MFDFEKLIGLEKDKALKILAENGYNDTKVVINSKENGQTDSLLVVKIENDYGSIRLICGEFYLKIKG